MAPSLKLNEHVGDLPPHLSLSFMAIELHGIMSLCQVLIVAARETRLIVLLLYNEYHY